MSAISNRGMEHDIREVQIKQEEVKVCWQSLSLDNMKMAMVKLVSPTNYLEVTSRRWAKEVVL